jgi:hypothetical protein
VPRSTTLIQPIQLFKVKTVTGQEIMVQTQGEFEFFTNQSAKYMAENTFTAIADLQDLDRLLFLELLSHRATTWLASGQNYHGEPLVPHEQMDARKSIKENSPLISAIKNDLGLTKSQRDREQFESVGKYIQQLKARAREHGVKREKELTKALSLIKELFSLVGTFDRSNAVEREKLGLETSDDVLGWIRDTMKPEFDAIDEYFRQHDQRFWVRDI